jgi:hypothetical protein
MVMKTPQHHTLTGHSDVLSEKIPPAPVAEIQSPMAMVTAYNPTRFIVGRGHFGFHSVVSLVVQELHVSVVETLFICIRQISSELNENKQTLIS